MSIYKWVLDPHHSELIFKIKHLMISTVSGYFKSFSVKAYTKDDELTTFTEIVFKADINSITTNNEQRDLHLKSKDFFDVENFPVITFFASEFSDYNNNALKGNLTIKGITKEINIKAEFNGVISDNYGQTKAGFSISGVISRKEFELSWNSLTETGGIVLGDDVKFTAEIQLIKTAIEEPAIKEAGLQLSHQIN